MKDVFLRSVLFGEVEFLVKMVSRKNLTDRKQLDNAALNGLKAVVSREINPPSLKLWRGSCRFYLLFKNMEFSATANNLSFVGG